MSTSVDRTTWDSALAAEFAHRVKMRKEKTSSWRRPEAVKQRATQGDLHWATKFDLLDTAQQNSHARTYSTLGRSAPNTSKWRRSAADLLLQRPNTS